MERLILSHLVFNETYGRKVLPFLKPEYFRDQNEKAVYELVDSYVKTYNAFPTKEILFIDLSNKTGIDEKQYKATQEIISSLEIDKTTKLEWLVDKTEEFCQDRALHNAIYEAIRIYDGKSQTSKGGLPKLLQDALQVTFDNAVGHDFIEDSDDRFDSYQRVEERVDFDLEYFNKITQGGLPRKTLTCILAETGGFKSGAMCHFAAHNLMCNKNVLYLTLEMAEERIAQRIDANLLDIPLNEFTQLSKIEYQKKMDKLRRTTKGKLIVKEYPTGTVGAAHFRHLLNELRIKKNFVPDVIYIDYLNLCTSSRIKMGANVNSYSYIKSIAEEIRGLAVEFNLPIVTATQANRSAYGSSDIDLDNTSDSIGLPMTVDFMFALISTEELEDLGQLLVKQLKNRFGDPNHYRRFVVGIDRAKMRLYNADPSAQEGLLGGPDDEEDDSPVFSKSQFGEEDEERAKPKRKFDKSKFSGFK